MKECCFSIPVAEGAVKVNVVSLPHSFFIWIGENAMFSNLNIASCNRFSKTPSNVNLLGSQTDNMMAEKLCKIFGKQVLLSYNVEIDAADQNIVQDLIMKSIIQHLKSLPP